MSKGCERAEEQDNLESKKVKVGGWEENMSFSVSGCGSGLVLGLCPPVCPSGTEHIPFGSQRTAGRGHRGNHCLRTDRRGFLHSRTESTQATTHLDPDSQNSKRRQWAFKETEYSTQVYFSFLYYSVQFKSIEASCPFYWYVSYF